MRAVKDGDDYMIDGTKTWITNSVQGLMLAVLVKTDPEASPPHRGMSLILVPKSAGYKASKLKKLGYRGIDTGEVQFDGVRVPQSHLIGDVEGRGLQQILAGLELGRINVASRGVGVADAALQDSLVYAKERKTFGKPICEHQAIQLKLADMATRVYAARRLVEDAAIAYDTGERCDMEASLSLIHI